MAASLRSRIFAAGTLTAILAMSLSTSLPLPAGAATKKRTKPKTTTAAKFTATAGAACSPAGTRSALTNLDCVSVGKLLQLQPRGSKANPIRLNDTAEYVAYENDRYRLKITGSSPRSPSDIGAGASGRPPIPVGSAPLLINGELTYLGPNPGGDMPARLSAIDVVDGTDKVYATYGGQECDAYGTTPNVSWGQRSLVKDMPQTQGLCIVLPMAVVGPKLLMHLSWTGDKPGIWLQTTA